MSNKQQNRINERMVIKVYKKHKSFKMRGDESCDPQSLLVGWHIVSDVF